MLQRGKTWLAVCSLALAGFLLAAPVDAQEKKAASIFKTKGSPLALKDGKATFDGELDDKDAVIQKHYYKVFLVEFQKGETYRIDYKSDDFDCLLFLEDPAGKKIADDDDGGEKLNSRLVYKASATGAYRVITTAIPPGKTGKFTLEINPATAAEIKIAVLVESVGKLDKAPPAEQKKIIGEATAFLKSKAGKLSAADARLTGQLSLAIEGTPAAAAGFKELVSILRSADNPQIRASAKPFERIGKEFPVAGKTVDGKDFDLKNLKGKVVLVDFWATWCGPCIGEIPNMLEAHKKYGKRGFEIIGVSLDRDDDDIVQFNEKRNIPWKSINIEDSRKLANEYGVNSIPFPVLVDRAGHVVSLRARGPQLDRLLERLFADEKK